ncbi:hypothetical protein AB3M83_02880 [Microbacterium sp. 179-B 1A2 NHS]|uniref:hypothetical protein n=1 Tax=Microbacterium sp. 179-B 1A2 NHS TaxID=3142383 RepID=UPI0039A38687
MTAYDLLRVLGRRWYVLALVVGLTVAAGWSFARDGGLHFTRTVIAFTAADSGPWEEAGSSDRGVILFASAIAAEVNGGMAPIAYSSADAPYYGAGIREGVRVSLPDTGGQWEVAYKNATIAIDVVSPDPDWVADRQQEMVAAVRSAADTRQTGIPAQNRIAVEVEPLSVTIEHVSPSRTAQLLAITALGACALLCGGWLAVTWDRRRAQQGEQAAARDAVAAHEGAALAVASRGETRSHETG